MQLTVWNTTHVTSDYDRVQNDPASPTRRHQFGTYDGNLGFSLNVSIPDVQGSIIEVVESKHIIGGISGRNSDIAVEPGHLWALSLEPGQEGTLLWNVTFTPPKALMDPTEVYHYGQGYGSESAIRNSFSRMQGPWVSSEEGVFFFWEGATRQLWGFNLETGEMLWGPTEPQENVWMMFRMIPVVANGVIYTGGHRGGGEIHAYNITTGETLWAYLPKYVGFEGFQSNPPNMINAVADGKVYITQNEHTPNMPYRRDSVITCLNASTGEEIWKLSQFNGEIGSFAMSSGYVIVNNVYDGRWYCIGKGPSATTVTASPKIVSHGSSVLIEGSVTDQSPGDTCLGIPTAGTPAIADEHQKAWMEYLHMQQPMPMNATGVEVVLETLDPNGDYYEIGRATSDASGMYKLMWEPPDEGEYTIVASFEGSKSYGSSFAETAIGVAEAGAAGAQGPPGPQGETGPIGPEGPAADTGNLTLIAIGSIAIALIAITLAAYVFMKRRG
jgi:outer membrane protein assembly factor BamB